jgi:hypothetical protein
MKLLKVLTAIALGLSVAHAQQDPLTRSIDGDLAQAWEDYFSLCTRVLRYKGQGKDDVALKQLQHTTSDYRVRQRYKIAASRPKDEFWTQFATAIAPPPDPVDCQIDLANMLELHLAERPKGLGDAANDSDTSSFLALSDLLASIPEDGFGGYYGPGRDDVAEVYRTCFADPVNLFSMVKRTLGQAPQ